MQFFLGYLHEIANFLLEITGLFFGAWIIASIIVVIIQYYIEKYCKKINVNLNKEIYVEKKNNGTTDLPSFELEFNPNYTILEKYIREIQIIHAIVIWIIFIVLHYDI